MRAAAIALLTITLSAPARGADGMTTANLRTLCLAQSGTTARLTCSGYLVGFVDGAAMVAATSSRPPWCAKDADIENTFLRYSRAHAEDDGQLAAVTIYLAMKEAYPCR
jgi:hypothetical protein